MERSRYHVTPRAGELAVLAYESQMGRYHPVAAIEPPLAPGLGGHLRLSPIPLPYLKPLKP